MNAHARSTSPKGSDRFFERIIKDGVIETDVIHGFVGRRLRANRLIQKTNGLTPALTGIDHTLVFHMAGGAVEKFEGKKRTGRSEKLRTSTVIPAHDESGWNIPKTVDVLHLYIDDADLRRFAAEEYGFDTDRLEMRALMGIDDPFMHYLAPLVLEELKSDLPQTRLMLDGFDKVIAGHMLRAYSNMSEIVLERDERARDHRDAATIKRAQDMLRARLDENLSATDIGAALDISPFRLMRIFKRTVGLTLHQFVLQERVAFVKQRITHSDDALVDIAYDAGFASQSHMNTSYARIMGIAPGRHRKQLPA